MPGQQARFCLRSQGLLLYIVKVTVSERDHAVVVKNIANDRSLFRSGFRFCSFLVFYTRRSVVYSRSCFLWFLVRFLPDTAPPVELSTSSKETHAAVMVVLGMRFPLTSLKVSRKLGICGKCATTAPKNTRNNKNNSKSYKTGIKITGKNSEVRTSCQCQIGGLGSHLIQAERQPNEEGIQNRRRNRPRAAPRHPLFLSLSEQIIF